MDVTFMTKRKSSTAEPLPVASLKAPDTQTQSFAQVLEQATSSQTITKPEPATLASLTKPRSHLKLTSLNPVIESYTPQPAAMERIGNSRILPFSLNNH